MYSEHKSLAFHDCGNNEQVWKNDSEMEGGKTLKNKLILGFFCFGIFCSNWE